MQKVNNIFITNQHNNSNDSNGSKETSSNESLEKSNKRQNKRPIDQPDEFDYIDSNIDYNVTNKTNSSDSTSSGEMILSEDLDFTDSPNLSTALVEIKSDNLIDQNIEDEQEQYSIGLTSITDAIKLSQQKQSEQSSDDEDENPLNHYKRRYMGNNYNLRSTNGKTQYPQNLKYPENPQESLKEKIERMKNAYANAKPAYRRGFKFVSDDDKPRGIVGLGNLGNTCYMNSILQCLFNVKSFYDNMIDPSVIKLLYPLSLKLTPEEDKNNYSVIMAKSLMTLTYQLHNLFTKIWLDTSKHIRPISFKNIFANKIQAFQSFEQQDSQEALLCILDTVHTETQRIVDIDYKLFTPEYLEFFNLIEQNKISDIDCCKMESQVPHIWELLCVKRALDSYNKKSYSFITKNFQNLVSSTLQCPECNYHTYSFDPTNILTVPIPSNFEINMEEVNKKMERFLHLPEIKQEMIRKQLISNELSNKSFDLSECFANLVHTEKLDDENRWGCPHCDIKVNAFKKMSIWVPSKVLIVHIKRFIHSFSEKGYSASKLNNMINYPITDFNINEYMSDYSKQLGNFTYDLIGVVNHIGGMGGGHYYSYVKSITDEKWYCMDDDSVTLLDENDIVSQSAYMLFYQLRE